VNYAVWRGDSTKHCFVCDLTGDPSSWKYGTTGGAISYAETHTASAAAGGAISYAETHTASDGSAPEHSIAVESVDPVEPVEPVSSLESSLALSRTRTHAQASSDADDVNVFKTNPATQEGRDVGEEEGSGDGAEERTTSSTFLQRTDFGELRDTKTRVRFGLPTAKYVLKSLNYGQNWTWTKFPDFLQSVSVLEVDPTDASVLYAIAPKCLSTSTDKGESWSPCSNATGLTGSFVSLIIKVGI
jgi:hypothetical protein